MKRIKTKKSNYKECKILKPIYDRPISRNVKYIIPDYVNEYTKTTPDIQNMVSMVNTGSILKLNEICSRIPVTEYRPERFAAAIVKIAIEGVEENNTGLVYTTGKQVTAGGKYEEQAIFLGHLYLTIFGNIKRKICKYDPRTMRMLKGYPIEIPLCRWLRFSKMTIANIVAKFRIDKKFIFLNEIHRNNRNNTKYTPTTFPSVRASFNGYTASIFDSGWILILGCKKSEDLNSAKDEIIRMIMDTFERKKATDALRCSIWFRSNEKSIDPGFVPKDDDITDDIKKKRELDEQEDITPPDDLINTKSNFENRIETYLYPNNRLIYSSSNAKFDFSQIKNTREIMEPLNVFCLERIGRKLLYKNINKENEKDEKL